MMAWGRVLLPSYQTAACYVSDIKKQLGISVLKQPESGALIPFAPEAFSGRGLELLHVPIPASLGPTALEDLGALWI